MSDTQKSESPAATGQFAEQSTTDSAIIASAQEISNTVRVSFFATLSADALTPWNGQWSDLCTYLQNPPEFPTKGACPLLKLAAFGDARTLKGSLRHDANVTAIYGIEGDHDASTMSPEEAVLLLQQAGVEALIYTSPSHTLAAPRWRVLAPTSQPHAPAAHRELVGRLNAVLRSAFSSESFALSQAYYYGRVSGAPYVAYRSHGACIDQAQGLAPVFPGGNALPAARPESFDLSDAPVPEWRGPEDDDELIRRALASRSAAAAFGNKASFADLWERNTERLALAFPDASRDFDASAADAALASHLAWWTGRNGQRIERLMRKSALRRDKWDSHPDYLRRSIANVLARGGDVLKDKPPAPSVTDVAAPSSAVTLQGVDASLLQLGTQDSVAQIFARLMGGKMLYNHTRDRWLEWDGSRWQLEETKKALNFARDLARSVNYDGSRSIGSASFCAGVEQLAKADPVLSAKGSDFDRDNYLLNTPGGTFDLRTNTLRPHDPEDRITMCTAASPCSDGGAVFDRFMDEVTLGDRELVEFHQVSLGACLSGAVEAHWMLFWTGSGRNGKNTLGDLVQDAMGDYARKVPTSTLMAKQHEGHPTEIANLQGVRLAFSSEINDGEHWHEARINELTGDATLSARFMRGDLFTFRRTHKHLIYGNHRPQLRTVGKAITSRIKIVPFKASFLGREDADLPRRLRENLGYVLAWLIEGHRKWLHSGKRLPRCKAVEDESADYFAAQSTPEMWLAERVQILATDTRLANQCPRSGDLYQDYAGWKKARGENPISQTRWAETMGKKFQRETSNGVRYRGLALLPQFAIPQPN